MVEERESPSADWREIYDEMGVDDEGHEASDEAARERCSECGLVVPRNEEHRCPLVDKGTDLHVEFVVPLREPGESD